MKKNNSHFIRALLLVITSLTNSYAQSNFLDTAFGTNGIVTTELFQPKAITVQQDGKILVTGGTFIRRFNTDGTPDAGFGTQGMVDVTAMGVGSLASTAQLSSGKLLIMGVKTAKYAFVRLNSDGNTDTGFGNNGVKIITHQFTPYGYWDTPRKMVALPDGKIMSIGVNTSAVPGWADVYATKAVIARYNADLTPDLTFNQTGFNRFDGPGMGFQLKDVAVYENGNAVVGLQAAGNVKLWKFLQNGQTDIAFGTNGSSTIDLGSNDDRLNGIAINSDGKLLISGSKPEGFHSAVLYRTLPNGSLDATYGISGIFTLPNTSGNHEMAVQSIVLNDGSVVSGVHQWNDSMDYGLLFTNADGTLDIASGNGGTIVTPFNNLQSLTCIVQQADGKILAAGFDQTYMVLMRYNISEALSLKPLGPPVPEVTVFPNPADDTIIIGGMPDNTPICIYTLTGQKIHEIIPASNTAIDISGLTAGMYLVDTPYGLLKVVKR